MNQDAILTLRDVSVTYETAKGTVQAVSYVSFDLMPNTVMGLVGESGSGKSTLAMALMRLLRGESRLSCGEILIQGRNIYEMDKKTLRRFRWNTMSMVFQSAMTVLNPVLTVEQQMVDVFMAHRPRISRSDARHLAWKLLDMVRIDRRHAASYPHELSGGMKQRIVIAIAMALEPSLIIMDEPTTALDVVVQRSILDQIKELQSLRGFAILFISHDFNLVTELASRVAVMYGGRIVEITNSVDTAKNEHHHPYTEGLMKAIPRLTHEDVIIEDIPGHPPDLIHLPPGCAYHPRCPYAVSVCRIHQPEPLPVANGIIACHRFDPSRKGEFSHVG